MTRVIFVGEMYNADLSVGGGPIIPPGAPPGYWGGVAPPLPTHPIAPGGPPPGYWGGVAPPYPSTGPVPPQPGGSWVVPGTIVVSVW